MNCNDAKYRCGTMLPSSCVLLTADIPDYISDLTCDANLDEFLDKMNEQIQLLTDDSDLTNLTQQCLVFDPATISIKGLHQVEINKLCDLETRLAAVELALDDDIGNQLINLDMGCLTPQAAPCAQGINVYTLVSILTVFKNEICAIKASLNL